MSRDSDNYSENTPEETIPETNTENSGDSESQVLIQFNFSAPNLSTQFSGNFNITNPADKSIVFSTTSTLINNTLTNLNFTNGFQLTQNKLSYNSRALNFQHRFDNKLSDVDLNINLADNDGNYSLSAGSTYNGENVGTTVTTNATVSVEDGNVSYSASASAHNDINITGIGVITDANAKLENGEFDYSVQTTAQKEINGVDNTATIYNDKNQTYISAASSMKKSRILSSETDETKTHNLININNPNGNEEQQRVEQLKNTDYVFNFMTKDGYSNEKSSFFSENSLIAMLGQNSYTNLTHRIDKHSNFFNCKLDLDKFNIDYDYTNTKSEDGNNSTVQNLSTMYKGRKTIVAMEASKEKIVPTEGEEVGNYTIGLNTSYGRDEYSNVFGSGFNFQTAGSLVLNDKGKVDGYEASADAAWNRYGSDHGGENDVLLQARYDISKKNNIKNMNASLCSLFRFNHEWTSIEPQIHYSYTKADDMKEQTLSYHLGYYQQIGKKWGDAYFSIVGEYEHNLSDKTKSYAGVIANIRKQATKRLTFGAEAQYYTNVGASGNLNLQVNF